MQALRTPGSRRLGRQGRGYDAEATCGSREGPSLQHPWTTQQNDHFLRYHGDHRWHLDHRGSPAVPRWRGPTFTMVGSGEMALQVLVITPSSTSVHILEGNCLSPAQRESEGKTSDGC